MPAEKPVYREPEVPVTGGRVALAALLTAPFLASFLFSHPPSLLIFTKQEIVFPLLAWTLVLIVGAPIWQNAYLSLRARRLTTDTLCLIGTLSATLWSSYALFTDRPKYFAAAGTILFFFLLGKWLETRQRRKAGKAIESLLELHPRLAHRVGHGGIIEDVSPQELDIGDRCLVKSGESIPLDGIVIKGRSSVNESMLTGEAIPVEKGPKDKLFGGTINETGSFLMRITVLPGHSTLDTILATVTEAISTKSRVEKTADRITARFIPVVLSLSFLTCICWIVAGASMALAIERAIAILIVACPCALGLAAPAAIMIGTEVGAKQGILMKNSEALEMAQDVDLIVFDKTGTLTKGRPILTDIVPTAGFTDADLVRVAVSLEAASEHPLARAVSEAAESLKIRPDGVTVFEAIPGQGVQAELDNVIAKLGNEDWIKTEVSDIDARLTPLAQTLREAGKTVIFVALGDRVIGLLAAQDVLHEDAKVAIETLKRANYKLMILSGDHAATVTAIGHTLGIEQTRAQVSPLEKADTIKALQSQGHRVAFVGDGLNDAAALAQAHIGIAMGTGTDAAMASGQIVLVSGSPGKVSDALLLSQITFKIIRRNLFWAFSYNLIWIPLAGFGVLNPAITGMLMLFSSMSVVANSARIVRMMKK